MYTTETFAGRSPGSDVPSWIWLWLPVVILAALLASRLVIADVYAYETWIESERGVIENGTAIILFPAIVLGLRIYLRRRLLPGPWLGTWILLLTAAALFFSGEEISWGQQWFVWDTPNWMAAHNLQGETNLHNISKQLTSRTPKFIAGATVILGGLLFPLWQRWRGVSWDPENWRYWLAPTSIVVPTAVLALLCRLTDRVAVWLDLDGTPPLDVDFGEIQELYIGLFLTLYLYSIFCRLTARAVSAGTPETNRSQT